MSYKLTLIVPAYNEFASLEKFLPDLIAFCKTTNYSLMLVNDGSTDHTGDLMDNYKTENFVNVIHHKLNRGYGASIKSAIKIAQTDYVVTLDADGQHSPEDILKLVNKLNETNADMVVGSRVNGKNYYRNFGKSLIRKIAGLLMPLKIRDINSGMKIYDTSLAKTYIRICPDTMAFSDIILLTFVYKKHKVEETPITLKPRIGGKSTINTSTAIDTIREILNIVLLFNPMRIFFPIGLLSILVSTLWDIHIFLIGNGLSVGSLLGIVTGIIFFFFGLIAEQISAFRREMLE